jgi:hypothetical protein
MAMCRNVLRLVPEKRSFNGLHLRTCGGLSCSPYPCCMRGFGGTTRTVPIRNIEPLNEIAAQFADALSLDSMQP